MTKIIVYKKYYWMLKQVYKLNISSPFVFIILGVVSDKIRWWLGMTWSL